jgi:hypothetical protein
MKKRIPVVPQLIPREVNEQQRDMSVVTTMEIFNKVRDDAVNQRYYDKEMWEHLEGRLKYLLHMVGMQ